MRIYLYAFFVLCLVLVAHILGLNGFYDRIAGYDILMHILGGIGIGLTIFAIINLHGKTIERKREAVIFGVLVVGLVWELFEMYFDITGMPLWTIPYYIDTAKDLFDDLLGGAIAVWMSTKL